MFHTLGLLKHNWKSFDFDLALQIFKKKKVQKFGVDKMLSFIPDGRLRPSPSQEDVMLI